MPDPVISAEEHAGRRAKLRRALEDAVGVVFAGEHDSHLPTPFRPDPTFEYLTGVVDEPGAVLVLDPAAPVAARREMLFLRPLNPELEKWDGYRLEVGKALRDRIGMQAVFRTTHLPRFLSAAAARAKRLACVHSLAQYNQPVSPDLAIFRKLLERIPGAEIVDRSDQMPELRAVKSTAERRMIQRAIDITAIGFDTVMRAIEPGMNEFDVQETLEHAYRANG